MFAGFVFQAEQNLRDLPVRGRQSQAGPGLRGKAIGFREPPGLAGKISADRIP
jgi:hypothetical protein